MELKKKNYECWSLSDTIMYMPLRFHFPNVTTDYLSFRLLMQIVALVGQNGGLNKNELMLGLLNNQAQVALPTYLVVV